MKIFSYSRNDRPGIGVDTGDDVLDLTLAFEAYQKAQGIKQPVQVVFLQMLVEMGYCSKATIDHILGNSWVQAKLEKIKLAPGFTYELPIARPGNLLCLGRNYAGHIKELSDKTPKEPLFFAKAPSSLTAHKRQVIIPGWLGTRVDHEAELAVIIGKEGKNITRQEAMEHVAGFTIVNDVTAREMQQQDIAAGNPWFRSKSFDTFCPAGPFIVPADALPDYQKLDITLKVNGETRQQANTADMIFSVPEIIAYISRYLTLQPGDIISTGTPEGISPLSDGDEIEISIDGLGVLRNSVRIEQ